MLLHAKRIADLESRLAAAESSCARLTQERDEAVRERDEFERSALAAGPMLDERDRIIAAHKETISRVTNERDAALATVAAVRGRLVMMRARGFATFSIDEVLAALDAATTGKGD